MSRRPKKNTPAQKTGGGPARTTEAPGGRQDYARWIVPAVCVALAMITWAVFYRTIMYGFIRYDDNAYVYENADVARGLSLGTMRWAFTHSDLFLWTPLTTLSHMLDCQIYGLHPAGHHLTNVVLHMINVVLLFLVLRRMTGALWCSAFVAAVFAIHPLRVESVAWISERKDVLSGMFFMLTLGAYHHYVTRGKSLRSYLVVMLMLTLGLMAKQMLVTVPFLLLLLDYWPLNRFALAEKNGGFFRTALRLVVEKIPLFALTILSCAQTYFESHSLVVANIGFTQVVRTSWLRVGNAFVGYVTYAWQMLYPSKLAVLYPFPAQLPAWQALGAVALLATISIAVFLLRRKHPEFLVGWFWYLGLLVPVIGFMQLGNEAHADRYTYLPQIGICIMLTWAVSAITIALPRRREILGVAGGAVIAVLAWRATVQTAYWRDSETLWKRTLACTTDNAYAHNFLGYSFISDGREDEAIAEFRKALDILPRYAEAEDNFGIALLQTGKVDEAILHFQKALEINPRHVDAHSNLAIAYTQKNRMDDAIAELRMVMELKPHRPDAYSNLGMVLLQKGDVDDAIAQFKKALEIKPDYADAYGNYGNALLQKGDPREALALYQKALLLDPQNVSVQITMARVLATCPDASLRDGNKAVVLALQTDEISGGKNPGFLDTLAAAYAEAGRFPEAIETLHRALELAAGDEEMLQNLQAHMALYRSNTPLRTPLKRPPGH